MKLLRVENLRTYYYGNGSVVPAVDDVSFTVDRHETVGIVGESGCGKSTIARAILRLLEEPQGRIVAGRILLDGEDLVAKSQREMTRIRGDRISMIFQNPLTSLNPVYTVGDQIMEALQLHQRMERSAARERAIEMLRVVEIPSPERRIADYPHQLSGGMQQRVLIAIALSCNPELLIADEPTTALDVTIQAQIMDLLINMRSMYGMGIILITHDMGVIAEMCDRVLVMYGGIVVEEGPALELFADPVHPYTRGLLASIPSIEEDNEELLSIKGTVPRFTLPVVGCRFASRCPLVEPICREQAPATTEVGQGHTAACWLSDREL
jgi:peptide/nickel transport system ATP-binding protein/oligopeptide transport system ATP-binding protein